MRFRLDLQSAATPDIEYEGKGGSFEDEVIEDANSVNNNDGLFPDMFVIFVKRVHNISNRTEIISVFAQNYHTTHPVSAKNNKENAQFNHH